MKSETQSKAEIEQLHRTLERQAAELESKNRELEIEAALERVRERAMAMHKSEELSEVIAVLYEQTSLLEFAGWGCGISIFNKEENYLELWISVHPEKIQPRGYKIFGQDHDLIIKLWDIWTKKKSNQFIDLIDPKKKDYDDYVFSKTELSQIPEQVIQFIRSKPNSFASFTPMKCGLISFYDSKSSLSKESFAILQRFAKVFDQAYTRFLDLQKAEVQAREAQIESALERVRSLTMAMHTSEDVGKCIVRMFDELTALGLSKNARTGIGIFNQENENMEVWTASRNQKDEFKIDIGILDMTLHPLLVEARKSWKSKTPFHQYILEGDDVKRYFTAINSSPNYHAQVNKQHLTERVYHYDFVFNHGILFSFTDAPLPEEQLQIFQRFSALFNQTYTRYLDLQKAEAQAREAQIEAALERVRARTMAMHKSEELGEVAAVLFDQFEALGATPERLNIGIVREAERIIEWWSTEQGGKQIDHLFKGTIDEPTTISKVFSGWKAGKKSIEIDLSGQELKEWISYLQKELGLPFDKKFQRDRRVHFACCYSHGMLLVSTPKPLPEDSKVLLQRFTNVFEQTYTRFLDLLKAEAQAREAQIEAALERVRARAMAMHQTSELNEVSMVLYEELIKLGFQFISCGFEIILEEEQVLNVWNHDFNQGQLSHFQMPLKGDNTLKERYEAWKSRKAIFLQELQGIALNKHLRLGAPENVKNEKDLISIFQILPISALLIFQKVVSMLLEIAKYKLITRRFFFFSPRYSSRHTPDFSIFKKPKNRQERRRSKQP